MEGTSKSKQYIGIIACIHEKHYDGMYGIGDSILSYFHVVNTRGGIHYPYKHNLKGTIDQVCSKGQRNIKAVHSAS